MQEEMILELIGRDSWSRPVYKDETGKLWKDVEPRSYCDPCLCTSTSNEFDGEPDTPMSVIKKYHGVNVVFHPKRDTW